MINNQNKIVLFNILSTVVLQGLAFFAAPLFSRLLGTANYGIVTVYMTWVSIISAVFGLQTQSTLAVAKKDFPIEEQRKYQASALFLSIISFCFFSCLALIGCIIVSGKVEINYLMIVCAFVHAFGSFVINYVNTKYTYEFRADRNFILSVAISILTISLSIAFIVLLPNDVNYWGRIAGQTIGYGGIAVLLASFVIYEGKSLYNKLYWQYCIPLAVPIVFHQISNLLLNQSDKIMLQTMSNNSIVGIYGLAAGFAIVMSYIWSALNNSWVPFYYEYTKSNQIAEIRKHSKNYLQVYSILSIGFILLTPEVFHLYASREYWDGMKIIPVLVVGYFFVFLYSFPVNYEFYNKKTKTIAIGTALTTVINIALNYIFISKMSAFGAAVATMIAHGIQFLFHYFAARKIKTDTPFPFNMSFFCPYVGYVVLSTGIFYLFFESWLIRWGLASIIGVFLIVNIYKRRALF